MNTPCVGCSGVSRPPLTLPPPPRPARARQTFYTDQGLVNEDLDLEHGGRRSSLPRHHLLGLYKSFIREFRENESLQFIYRDQLKSCHINGANKLQVKLEHVAQYDEKLMEALMETPNEQLELFESAAKAVLKSLLTVSEQQSKDSDVLVPDVQVLLQSDERPTPMRSLGSNDMNRLVCIPGIIISATRAFAKATSVVLMCKNCESYKTVHLDKAHGSAMAPSKCWAEECDKKDSLVLVADMAAFVDQQDLKLQEAPEVVPTGEMPRSLLVSMDRSLVDSVGVSFRAHVGD
jgi:DNA replication licensing factor MCM5